MAVKVVEISFPSIHESQQTEFFVHFKALLCCIYFYYSIPISFRIRKKGDDKLQEKSRKSRDVVA